MRKSTRRSRHGRYCIGIILPIIAVAFLFFSIVVVGAIDGGAEFGNFPKTEHATITVTVTLDNGHCYEVDIKDKNVLVNTYGSSNPVNWDIAQW